MTDGENSRALATILETLAVLTKEVDAIARRQVGIEQALSAVSQATEGLTTLEQRLSDLARDQAETVTRLGTLDVGQAAIAQDLKTDRLTNRASLVLIAELAARAHTAACGIKAPLPANVADSPLLERYLITQPADYVTATRALAEWRQQVPKAASRELAQLLARQYEPSPTDTPETRVLRYQLAAITRAELAGRGVTPPAAPQTTVTRDRSPEARAARSKELADLWRAGESLALYGEPELAAAIDRFAVADRQAAILHGDQIPAELVTLHRDIAARIEAGERSFEVSTMPPAALHRSSDMER
ncbi:hypothetical protein [Sphingomonas kyungheensis]|uniref:Uncharacterized protein n=1 Tax=Sphingomonas kyungheensis TaxID=1069987 RepID=A0ABU8H7C0_9SPHN